MNGPWEFAYGKAFRDHVFWYERLWRQIDSWIRASLQSDIHQEYQGITDTGAVNEEDDTIRIEYCALFRQLSDITKCI